MPKDSRFEFLPAFEVCHGVQIDRFPHFCCHDDVFVDSTLPILFGRCVKGTAMANLSSLWHRALRVQRNRFKFELIPFSKMFRMFLEQKKKHLEHFSVSSLRSLRCTVDAYSRMGLRRPPTVHYVAPSFWAWKGGEERLKNLTTIVDHMLCILPFEEPVCRANGLAATFVGHPVLEDAQSAAAVCICWYLLFHSLFCTPPVGLGTLVTALRTNSVLLLPSVQDGSEKWRSGTETRFELVL